MKSEHPLRRLTGPLRVSATLLAALSAPAQAIVGATPTTHFQAVGQGVQVAPDWVFTVVHYALGVGQTYSNGYGSRIVAATYFAPGAGVFPENDFALLRLEPLATNAPYLVVNDAAVPNGTFAPLPFTLVSGANSGPARGAAFSTVSESAVMLDPDDAGPLTPVVVNYLLSWDSAVYVQGGDSGGGLFAGHVSDASVLWGLSSAQLTDEQNVPLGSGFVQPGAYRSWIDATLLADAADGDAVLWASAVPEPGAWALWAAGLGGAAGAVSRRRGANRASLAIGEDTANHGRSAP
jgi:hypothetical protein